MRVLVTGSNGQLGMSLRKIAGESHDFVFTDINDIPGQETVRLDITDKDAVMSMVCGEEKVDVIVNCAAYTNVDRAEEDSMTAELINSVAASNLAVAAKESGAVLVHISTDYVFGGDACVRRGVRYGSERSLRKDQTGWRACGKGFRMYVYHNSYLLAVFSIREEFREDYETADFWERKS